MILRLSNQVFKKMERHVLSTYPEEGCGVLIGSKKGTPIIVDVIPLKNVASELRTRRYRFDPLEFMKASEVAEENGQQVVGIFHSHPHHPSVPSEYDLNHAWPNLSYVILSVDGQRVKSIQSWRLGTDGGSKKFVEEDIEIENAEVK